MDDRAAVGGKSFIIEVENPVSLDVEERVEVEVSLRIVVEGFVAVILVTRAVLVVILVAGGMLEEGVKVEVGLGIVVV